MEADSHLTASDPADSTRFGRSGTFRDGILVVGADTAAYVFRRVNGVWKQMQRLTAPAADNVVSFADALRYENGTLAVGANTSDREGPGSVYVFVQDATGKFIRRARLVAADDSPNDGFGADISMAGPVMVVGAPGRGADLQSAGAAYVFRRSSTGVWRQQQKLVATESERGHRFGDAVAIDRAMIIVGAPLAEAAYGFIPTSGVYVETFKLQPRADEWGEYHNFGSRIAMFDRRIAISAMRELSSDSVLNGVVVFTYTRADWSVTPRGAAVGLHTSSSIALANNWLLVGSPCQNVAWCIGRAALYDVNRQE